MRIGVNTLFLLPGEVGGSQTYLCETLRALAAGHPGDEWILFTQRENDAFLRAWMSDTPRARTCRIDVSAARRSARIAYEQCVLPRRARREGIDLLWSPGYTAPLSGRIPQVVSILDMQYRRFPEDLGPVARLALHALVIGAARRAQRILTLSEFSRGEIVRFTPAGAGRVDVTPLAAHPRFAEPRPAEEGPGRHLPDPERPYILCVAHTYPHKNVHGLIAAFARCADRIPHRLVLIGKPRRGEGAVRRSLAGLADPTRVTRIPAVTDEALVSLYQHCALFVLPSQYEGFGLPVLEAMAAGTLVLASDIPALREIGGDGILPCRAHNPDALVSAIHAALAMPAGERAERIRRNRQHAATFAWARTAELTYRGFQRAMRGAAYKQE